jgi:hypothetical protein
VGTVARFAKRLEADPLGRKDSNSKRKEQECAREKRRLTVVPESGGKTIATLARIREPLE